MKPTLILIILSLIFSEAYSQNKKKVRENNVKTKIEWQYTYKDGVEIKYKECEYVFDEEGNIIVEKIYDEKGNIIKHVEFTYDKEDNLIREITYNPNNQILKKEEYIYQGNLKTEKKVYGPDGKLKNRKIYEYTKY